RSELAIQPRRRDLERVGAGQRVLDVEQRADLAADQLAVRKRHAAFLVRLPIDVQPYEPVAPHPQVEVDQLEPERTDGRLEQVDQTLFVRTGSHRLRLLSRQKKGLAGPSSSSLPPRPPRFI